MQYETNNNIISCDVINTLQDYFLSENNITTFLKNRLDNVKQNVKKVTNHIVKKQEHDFFIPKEKDSLFWCFYLIKNGDVSYEML
jgi:hypothetical protein